MSHRWMKFWPQDWQSDPALRMCSLAARGLWIECIAIMHRAEPYGHLIVNGRAPNDQQLAGMVGASEREVSRLVSELEQAGVFSRDAFGVIVSRRMVRDHEAAKAGKEAVSRRWHAAKPPSDPNRVPNSPPNRVPSRTPNSLEAEAEAEEDNSPTPSEYPPSAPKPATARRGSRLAADWMPGPDERAFAESLGLDPDKIAASFRDYWHAATGSNATKANWPATWRNWCRRDAERQPRRLPAPERPGKLDWLIRDMAAEAREAEPFPIIVDPRRLI